MRIGLLGGTFNPIHNGHLKLAEEAHRQLSLDAVMLIPSYMPPHKEADDLLDAQQRLRMIELAISGNINFEIYRYEIDKEEKSYTVDTVEYIRSSCPEDTKIFFLIGADSLVELDTWKDIEKLSKLCHFIVCDRPGFNKDSKYAWVDSIEITPVDVSSSEIRKRIRDGRDISGLLPEVVEDHIRENNLYK